MGEESKSPTQADSQTELLSVDEFLSENYSLFAVVGVLAALAVYMQNFQESASRELVNLGLVSALLMFLVTALILLFKLFQQATYADKVDIERVVPFSALIIGLGGLIVSISGVAFEFYTQFVQVIDWTIGVVIFTSYLIWFPWDKFSNADNVSKSTQKRLKKTPAVAINFTVCAIIIYADNSYAILQGLVKVDGYNKMIIFPGFIGAVVLHLIISNLIKEYCLWRDDNMEDKNEEEVILYE
ncbi:hypothetical protein [Natrinema sp. DC36]|uniref:hypothetical protein n=1 Tax=Natrinema sp. DC36 TaxID=2878680 RepID=UPI001CF03E18|nr:hypothetical protein [Natrinema sp. DC36]